jgi:hypothetical protein
MQRVIKSLKIVLPFLAVAIGALSSVSGDEAGKAGEVSSFLSYVQTGLQAVVNGEDIPAPPGAQTQPAASKKAASKKAASKARRK